MLLLPPLAGLLLFLSDQPLQWWPLQFVALVPLWLALHTATTGQAVLRGLLFAIGYGVPTVLVAGLDAPILVVAGSTLLQWPIVAVLAARLLNAHALLGPLALAAAVTLLEIGTWYAVPMFGTAQCFARPLSAAPAVVAFVAFTGLGGLVFALVTAQALVAQAIRGPHRGQPLMLAAGLGIGLAILSGQRWQRPLGATLSVAVFGWSQQQPADGASAKERFGLAFAAAKQAGARLLVTPETGASVGKERRPQALELFGQLARTHSLAAAIGVWHDPTRDNRIWFFGDDGTLLGEYRKTHLIPFLENYVAGDGTLVSVGVAGTDVGGMICQDDNFTDLARGYGQQGVPLVAVPTNDWASVRGFHFESSVFRAIEHGYAIARAATNGISAVISPRGVVVASHDHATDGPRLLTAAVELGDGQPTLYARCGDWLMVAICGALLLLMLPLARRRRSANGTPERT